MKNLLFLSLTIFSFLFSSGQPLFQMGNNYTKNQLVKDQYDIVWKAKKDFKAISYPKPDGYWGRNTPVPAADSLERRIAVVEQTLRSPYSVFSVSNPFVDSLIKRVIWLETSVDTFDNRIKNTETGINSFQLKLNEMGGFFAIQDSAQVADSAGPNVKFVFSGKDYYIRTMGDSLIELRSSVIH